MQDRERLIDALNSLDPGVQREEWARIGCAFKAGGGSLEDFDNWSSSAHNYGGSKDVEAVWRSFSVDGGITAKTLFHIARAAGWRDSARVRMNGNVRQIRQQPVRVAPQSALQSAAAAWGSGTQATPDHHYVQKKRLLTDGLRVYRGPLTIKGRAVGGWLMMPGFVNGELRTLQFIGPDAKLHFPGLLVEGFYTIGGKIEGDVYLGEGLGAAHTCHQAMRRPAVASFGAGNTARAAQWIVAQGGRPIIVADKGKEAQAAEIAREIDCAWVEMPADVPANYDINDMHCGADLDAVTRFLSGGVRRHARRYTLLSAADLLALPSIRWRVKGVLPETGVGVIGGQSTAGKTFIALDLAMRLASGTDFFGHRSYRCPVLYLALEGAGGFAGRLRAWRMTHGEIPHGVHFMVRQHFDVRNAQDRAELLRTMSDIGFRDGVIIIDTLAQAAIGMEENSSDGMGEAIAGLQDLQQAVGGLILASHHLGKDASKGLRGHSSLFAACDVVMEVSRDGDARAWRIAKNKDGRDSDEFGFELADVQIGEDYDGDAITSCVVRQVAAVKAKVIPLRGDRQVMANNVIGELLRNSSYFGRGGALPTRPCVELDVAIKAIGDRMTCPDHQRNNEARRVIMNLQRHNAICVSGGWIWSL